MHVAASVNALTGATTYLLSVSSGCNLFVVVIYVSSREPVGTTAAYDYYCCDIRPTTSWLSNNSQTSTQLEIHKAEKDMSTRHSKRPGFTPTRGTGTITRSKTPMPTTATSPPPPKRRRTASLEADLLTPPLLDEDQEQGDPLSSQSLMVSQSDFDSNSSNSIDENEDLFSHAAHVLATEAAALASITALYRTSPTAKKNLKSAVETILQSQQSRGKLIVSGVGKSAYIAQKLVATCKSMGVATSFMHACEAAHGDLGDVRDVSLT
jgi:hypothetical protein